MDTDRPLTFGYYCQAHEDLERLLPEASFRFGSMLRENAPIRVEIFLPGSGLLGRFRRWYRTGKIIGRGQDQDSYEVAFRAALNQALSH